MEKQGRVGNRVTVHISDLSISFLFSLSLSLSNLFIIGKHHNIYLPGGIRCYQFSSVTQLCPTLSNPMDCSMPGLPVHHQLQEFTQSHIHWVGDVIQPSHPLLSPSSPALNLSQHQGLFQWVSSSHQVAKVLEFQLPSNDTQDWSLGWIGWISLQSKGLTRVFSNTTVQKHRFFGP